MSQEGQENPPEEGSGWGWGWFSEAAKVAKAAYDSNVKPALQSMESSTSQFGMFLLLMQSTDQRCTSGTPWETEITATLATLTDP
jgi:hypothetical protein